jgi:hypothetical protein
MRSSILLGTIASILLLPVMSLATKASPLSPLAYPNKPIESDNILIGITQSISDGFRASASAIARVLPFDKEIKPLTAITHESHEEVLALFADSTCALSMTSDTENRLSKSISFVMDRETPEAARMFENSPQAYTWLTMALLSRRFKPLSTEYFQKFRSLKVGGAADTAALIPLNVTNERVAWLYSLPPSVRLGLRFQAVLRVPAVGGFISDAPLSRVQAATLAAMPTWPQTPEEHKFWWVNQSGWDKSVVHNPSEWDWEPIVLEAACANGTRLLEI